MYIDSVTLENVRTFTAEKKIHLLHPGKDYGGDTVPGEEAMPRPRLPNVTLVLGDNGSGKTTLLETLALLTLGPAVNEARLSPRLLVRFVPRRKKQTVRDRRNLAVMQTAVILHGAERFDVPTTTDMVVEDIRLTVQRLGELEKFEFQGSRHAQWERIYDSENETFFIVGYGSTRRMEQKTDFDMGKRRKGYFMRARRVEGVMQEGYPLVPLAAWLPHLREPRREQIIALINKLLGPGNFRFEGRQRGGEYLFLRGGLEIPFQSMSDGFRAYLGWTMDFLFHLNYACPRRDVELTRVPGVVLVDEIDLHLHPKWQMSVVETVARAFPLMQFVFTSHSSLVVGSLEWMNIVQLKLDGQHRTSVHRLKESVHGLNANQILLTDFFGLETTRAKSKRQQLQQLQKAASVGDREAAKEFLRALSRGSANEESVASDAEDTKEGNA